MLAPSPETARMSDEAVQRATGKPWAEWFAILDAAGAAEMPHPRIATYLNEQHNVPGWWAQTVTVEYERARGLRDVHQKTDGYSASVSKTLTVPVSRLYAAWMDETLRHKWLTEPMTVRRATENKSMRITWRNDSNVQVNFYAKGEAKSQMAIEHSKLSSHDDVEVQKRFWKEAVERLAVVLAVS